MIAGIDHIGIATRSIAETRRFYEALGLHVEEIEEVAEEGVRVAMIPCGETRIELLEPTRDDSPIAAFLSKRGPGIHHICLASDGVNQQSDALRQAGYNVLRSQATRGAGGCWVNFVHPKSSGGVLIELSQPPSDGPER